MTWQNTRCQIESNLPHRTPKAKEKDLPIYCAPISKEYTIYANIAIYILYPARSTDMRMALAVTAGERV